MTNAQTTIATPPWLHDQNLGADNCRNDITAEGLSRCRKHIILLLLWWCLQFTEVLCLWSNLARVWQMQDVNPRKAEPSYKIVLQGTEKCSWMISSKPSSVSCGWIVRSPYCLQAKVVTFQTELYATYMGIVVNHSDARFPVMPIIYCFSSVFTVDAHHLSWVYWDSFCPLFQKRLSCSFNPESPGPSPTSRCYYTNNFIMHCGLFWMPVPLGFFSSIPTELKLKIIPQSIYHIDILKIGDLWCFKST